MQAEPAIVEVQPLIQPKLTRLIDYVHEQHEMVTTGYFSELAIQLGKAGWPCFNRQTPPRWVAPDTGPVAPPLGAHWQGACG